jgi:transposase
MPKFIPYDYNQSSMVVINFEDQLVPGTFEHAVHYLIDNKLDVSVFYPRYQNDEVGRPAFDPAILLKIILFAYSKGITSTREIQWCCENNIIFKALSCNTVPHFTSIAGFVSNSPLEIESVFEQVLLICDEQGLLGKELFAIDGCKLPSDAAKEWSGTIKELTAKRDKIKRLIRHHLSEHQRLDKSEPRDETKIKRAKQAVKTLDKANDKIDRFLKTAQPRMGIGKRHKEVKSNITDNESAKMTTSKGTIQGYNGIATVDQKHQVIVDAQAFGAGSEQHTLQPIIEKIKERMQRLGVSEDVYDEGTVVTADTGFADEANMQYLHEQGIDAYVPDKDFRSRDPKFADQKARHGKTSKVKPMLTASEFQCDLQAKTCTCPAGQLMWLQGERIDLAGNPKLFFEGPVSQCRQCPMKHQCMKNPSAADAVKGRGRQVSFIMESQKEATHTDWMKERVDSEYGKYIYSHRMAVVEPVFGNITANKGLKRFSLRGKIKVQGQWQLYCLVHNIEKLANYGKMVA